MATGLAFTGPAHDAQVMSHVEKNESIDVRFDWKADARCEVRFKRWSKMEYDQNGVTVTGPERRNLAVDPTFVATPLNPAPTFLNVQPGTQEQSVQVMSSGQSAADRAMGGGTLARSGNA